MNNNCTSLLLLVALLSFNNSCGCNNNGCNSCNDCGCNNCGCNNCNNSGLFGNNAGLLCLLLAFLSSANCPLTTSV